MKITNQHPGSDPFVKDENGAVARSTRDKIQIAVKLALIAVICWLAFSTLAAFFEWGRGPQQIASIDDATLQSAIQPPPVPPVLLSAFDDGAWEFAGMPWQVRMATVQPGDIDRELEALPPAEELTAAASLEEGQKLLTMLRMMGARERKLGQLTLLQADSPAGRVVLVSRAGTTGDELVLGRIAWQEEAAWRLLEGRPATTSAAKQTDTSLSPPLPAEAEVLGTRWGNDGAFLGQIVSLAGPRGALVESWKAAGWSVARAPTEMTSADDAPLLLVERKGVCFSAHFFASPGGPITLFLTRVPE